MLRLYGWYAERLYEMLYFVEQYKAEILRISKEKESRENK